MSRLGSDGRLGGDGMLGSPIDGIVNDSDGRLGGDGMSGSDGKLGRLGGDGMLGSPIDGIVNDRLGNAGILHLDISPLPTHHEMNTESDSSTPGVSGFPVGGDVGDPGAVVP